MTEALGITDERIVGVKATKTADWSVLHFG